MESQTGLYKTELIKKRGPWKTLAEVELATAEYVEWFNSARLHSAIGHIPPITDEAGTPVHPEWYSDEFGRLLRRAGLRRITLHDSRHTTLTLMEHAGVPISIISKWAGHYDSAFTQKTYVHASEEDLQRGQAALARIHKIA